MSGAARRKPARLGGGALGPVLVASLALVLASLLLGTWAWPRWSRSYGHDLPFDRAMFGEAIEQPIAFSHRLHVTDKEIDCFYCHPFAERSTSAGIPPASKCLGCHDRIIPRHDEIEKLKAYRAEGREVDWVRVYYNPDHVFFPHDRHLAGRVACRRCHGEVEKADRLRKVTFTMGLCLDCHTERGAPTDCAACHE